MRLFRICAGLTAVVLAVALCAPAMGEERGLVRVPEKGRAWWGVLYSGAPYLARAEEQPPEGENGQVEFIWPLWQWLLSLLGLE